MPRLNAPNVGLRTPRSVIVTCASASDVRSAESIIVVNRAIRDLRHRFMFSSFYSRQKGAFQSSLRLQDDRSQAPSEVSGAARRSRVKASVIMSVQIDRSFT